MEVEESISPEVPPEVKAEGDVEKTEDTSMKGNDTISDEEVKDPDTLMALALSCKEDGNVKLKSGNINEAKSKYEEGVNHINGVPASYAQSADIRKTLNLNLSLAYIKLEQWEKAVRSASDALLVEAENTKGLFRRGLAGSRCGMLDEAKQDLLEVIRQEPKNSEARRELVALKNRIAEAREQNKKAYGNLFSKSNGFYSDREAEAAARVKAEEERRKRWEEENKARIERGDGEVSYEEWDKKDRGDETDSASKATTSASRGPKKTQKVAATNHSDDDYDEEDRKIMDETKKMGYCYFGKDVARDTAKTQYQPSRIDSTSSPSTVGAALPPSPPSAHHKSISSWNSAGTTWEEKDMSTWARSALEAKLKTIKLNSNTSCGVSDAANALEKMKTILQKSKATYSPTDMNELTKLTGTLIPCEIQVTGVDVSGDASVAVVRQSKRYLYDFEITVFWSYKMEGSMATSPEGKEEAYKGKYVFSDVSSTQVQGRHWGEEGRVKYDTEVGPTSQESLKGMLRQLKEEIVKKVDEFTSTFKESC